MLDELLSHKWVYVYVRYHLALAPDLVRGGALSASREPRLFEQLCSTAPCQSGDLCYVIYISA